MILGFQGMSESSSQIKNSDFATNPTDLTTAKWGCDDENTPVYTVVSAVADIEDSDPVDLPPLYDAINPEALNDLFTSRSESAVDQITFKYAGYSIVVRGNGEVEVYSA